MNQAESLVPVSVIAAIGLFVVKEILEAIRRFRADRRKKKAMRIMLARECELNMWVYKKVFEALETVLGDFESELQVRYTVENPPAGAPAFKRDGDLIGQSTQGFPNVQVSMVEKLMLDVASQDEKLFEKLEAAYDELIKMRHVRDSIIRFVATEDDNHKLFFESFPKYGLREIGGVEAALTALYKDCTGKAEVPPRLR